MKYISNFTWYRKILNKIITTEAITKDIKKVVDKELELRNKEMETRLTEDILKKLLKKNRESIQKDFLDENQISKLMDDKLKISNNLLNKNLSEEIEKISLEMKEELKKNSRSSEKMEVRLKNFGKEYHKSIEKIEKINIEAIKDFTSVLKEEVCNINNNIDDKFKENDNLKLKLKDQEDRYNSSLEEEVNENRKIKDELKKYEKGLKRVRELLAALEAPCLMSLKEDLYSRYSLNERIDRLTENTIKLALESKIGVTKYSLSKLRELKVDSQDKIKDEEIEFLTSINSYYGDEIVLLDRLDDSRVEREFWEIGGSYTKIDKIIFPPMKMGEIIPGVAQVDINIYNIVNKTSVLGPGYRYAVWFQGCKKKCNGCLAPDSHSFLDGEKVSTEKILQEIEGTKDIDGVTISGGEPFEQPKALYELLKGVRDLKKDLDIILYTGYLVENLLKLNDKIYKEILLLTDLVVDGEYIKGSDYNEPLKGSLNQSYYFFSSRGEEIIDEIEELEERKIEVQIKGNDIFYIGVPSKTQKNDFIL